MYELWWAGDVGVVSLQKNKQYHFVTATSLQMMGLNTCWFGVLSTFNSFAFFSNEKRQSTGAGVTTFSGYIYQWDDYTLEVLVTKGLLKAVPSYMSFRCWSEYWKALNHHELVLGVTCKTWIEQEPSAHPSNHVLMWIQFSCCSLACSWLFAIFVSFLAHLVT